MEYASESRTTCETCFSRHRPSTPHSTKSKVRVLAWDCVALSKIVEFVPVRFQCRKKKKHIEKPFLRNPGCCRSVECVSTQTFRREAKSGRDIVVQKLLSCLPTSAPMLEVT